MPFYYNSVINVCKKVDFKNPNSQYMVLLPKSSPIYTWFHLTRYFQFPKSVLSGDHRIPLLHVRKLSKEVVSFLSSYVWLLHPDEINAQANSRAHLQFVL